MIPGNLFLKAMVPIPTGGVVSRKMRSVFKASSLKREVFYLLMKNDKKEIRYYGEKIIYI